MESEKTLFTTAEKKGWCKKQGGRVKTWKKRWFVLKDNCLYYFKTSDDKETPCGIIPLENLHVRKVEIRSHKFAFEVYSTDGEIKSCKLSKGQMVQGHHGSYIMSAESAQEMESWVAAIQGNIASNPLFELIKRRREQRNIKDEVTTVFEASRSLEILDFQEIYDAALMCSMCYKSSRAIKEAYGLHAHVAVDTESNMRYFLLTNEKAKIQTVVICGTLTEAQLNQKGDVLGTLGFDKAAGQMDALVVKYLLKDYHIQIYAHSLGAALALLLAIHLKSHGHKVVRFVSFGQPRIIKEKDIGMYKEIPLTRIVDYNDPVPDSFPGYAHFGLEVVLFDGIYYSALKEHMSYGHSKLKFDANHIESYIRNLKLKIKTNLEIPFHERAEIGRKYKS